MIFYNIDRLVFKSLKKIKNSKEHCHLLTENPDRASSTTISHCLNTYFPVRLGRFESIFYPVSKRKISKILNKNKKNLIISDAQFKRGNHEKKKHTLRL